LIEHPLRSLTRSGAGFIFCLVRTAESGRFPIARRKNCVIGVFGDGDSNAAGQPVEFPGFFANTGVSP